MDFETYFKVHNLVSVYPKSVILGQMANLNMIFHVVVSVYRLIKICNTPQFPDEFRNGHNWNGEFSTHLPLLGLRPRCFTARMYTPYCKSKIINSPVTYLCQGPTRVPTKRSVNVWKYDQINKMTSVFYASVLLLILNFVITLSK